MKEMHRRPEKPERDPSPRQGSKPEQDPGFPQGSKPERDPSPRQGLKPEQDPSLPQGSNMEQITNLGRGLKKGRLKIFFGCASGVGKTHAMLEAAHDAKERGVDVAVGCIDSRIGSDAIALLKDLERIEPPAINKGGAASCELDLDGAAQRAPELLLVDELAHANAPGCRHKKRYQDIEELLKSGINVYTTLNVQHIESLNDVVAAITGGTVMDRIPDSVFDNADQVELVDMEPDELMERLAKAGGRLDGGQAAESSDREGGKPVFTREALVALREMALRRTADRVNKLAERGKAAGQGGEYLGGEHILTCLSDAPSNAKVIRTAARMANAFHGAFTAIYVENGKRGPLDEEGEKRLAENVKLSEQLGARVATVDGDDAPFQIAEYAKAMGVSKIVLGRSNAKRGVLFPKPAFADKLTEQAPNIDIYIIPDKPPAYSPKRPRAKRGFGLSALDLLKSAGILAASTLIGFWFYDRGFSEANIIMIYILGVLLTAMVTEGKLYSGVHSALSVLVFNFCFTIPRFTFQAYDKGYPITFLVMFIASFLTSTLTMRVKLQMKQSVRKAYRTEILLETSQKLQRAEDRRTIVSETAVQLRRLLSRTIVFYTPEGNGLSQPIIFEEEGEAARGLDSPEEKRAALWVYKNNKHAGATTNTLPDCRCLYLAVRSHDTVFAVVGVYMAGGAGGCASGAVKGGEAAGKTAAGRSAEGAGGAAERAAERAGGAAERAAAGDRPLESFEKNLMIAMLGECALALEKEQISRTKKDVEIKAQRERLRANLLRAISHDLRTPLTSISGNAGVLMENSRVLDEEKKQALYIDIYDDSMWLINLVENLLSITRLDKGDIELNLEAELLEDVVAEALLHISRKKSEHQISVELEDDLLMARMEPRLIMQVIINMVDNAIKYTPPGSRISISGKRQGSRLLVEIADDGPGIEESAKSRLFDMFYTAGRDGGDSRRGMGLGLALCKSIIEAHGGLVAVRDNAPRGTVFYFTLQAEEVSYSENE